MRTRPTARRAFWPPREASADAILGPEHPLSRVIGRIALTREQALVVSYMLAAGGGVVAGGAPVGLPLVLSAAFVLLSLLARLATLTATADRHALELVVDGRGSGLPVVERVRRRLGEPVRRERLARALDTMRREAARPPGACHRLATVYSVSVIRASELELGEVARLVRSGGSIRGIARAELLVTDGCSVLYGTSVEDLRRELGRIRFLLAADC